MSYFDKYVSNTLAASGNQSYFNSNNDNQFGRVIYKIYSGGEYGYSFLFSNTIDSTYADGTHSKANIKCKNWTINYLKAYVFDKDTVDFTTDNYKAEYSIKFNKKDSKEVIPGEIFYTDEVIISSEKNDYICLEIGFIGEQIPYFEELIIPSFRKENDTWMPSKQMPLSCMIGCTRKVEKKVGFLGDSITEGIGVDMNSYEHWNAKIAEEIGDKYSYWNLGIGFGRAADCASNGAWLNKAKEMDVVTICFGVNDLGRGYSETEIKCNLETIVRILQDNKVRTILFTIPPFDYEPSVKVKWLNINNYILNELSKITEVYDVAKIWGDSSPYEERAIYGGHPNREGSKAMVVDFLKKIKL